MPAKDLGTKWTCFKCTSKFYDLKKPDPVCPKCGADQRESPALKPAGESRRSRLAAKAPVVAPEPEESVLGGDTEEDEIEGIDDEEVEGASEDEEV